MLPKDFVQEEEGLWMEYFLKLGLRNSVTPDQYCSLCKDVAHGKLKDNTRTASRTLLDYLFSPDEAKLHQFHSNKGLLKKVSDIAFVCPVPMPELEWIHKVLPTTNRVILAEEEVPLCKLSGSCLAQSKELVWTVVPIVSVTVNAQKEVLESLGIHIQPNVQNVVKNIMNLSKTPFANPGLFMNYSVPNCRKGHTNLTDVILIIFRFLKPKQCQLNIEELKTIRCIPVHAITHESGGQYPVLVEPFRVVFRDVTETRSYYPFIHSISSPFYEARELLSALGVGDSVQIKHMQMVLESVYETSGGKKLDPNTCDVVNCAVYELASLLSRSTSFQTIKEETTISEKLTPLYLSGTDKRMHHVDSLVHSRTRNVNLRGTKYYLLWTPKMLAEEFCKLLPEAVRPKPLSELCTSMVSSTCEICEKTPYAIDLEKRLGNPTLLLAMCITVKHVTAKMDSQERGRYCETFEQHLSMLFQTLEIHCVNQLKIDMFLVGADPIVVASKNVKCYLQKEESSYHLYMDAKVRNVHVGEVHKCIAKELVHCLKRSPLTELELHKYNEFLEALLCADSSEDIYETLQDSEINCLELQNAIYFDIDEPKLGNYIPKWLQVERLDLRNTNIFQPQEWVAYQVSEERYIYAQVVHPVCLKDSKGEPLKPIHIEYIIFTSVEDEDGKRVTATDLYKFIRGEIQHKDSIPVDPDCQEVVPFEGHPCDAHPSNETFDLHQAKEEIRRDLQDIRYLSKTDQRKAIRRLYLRWHPDKNRSNQEVAEEAFKFLKDELDKLEQSSEASASTCVGRNYSWRDYQRSWDETAREHSMFYANSQDGSSSDQATSSSHRHRRGGSGRRGGFYSSIFTPSPNEHEGKRWVRQAVADCLALETLLNEAQTHAELSAHVCFMAHQVAEKALKGGMYATCGLGENSLKSHNISALGRAIEAVRPVKACGLAVLTSPLEPYYLDTRFPNRCLGPSIPSDNFSLSAAEAAAEYARGVLKIVKTVANM